MYNTCTYTYACVCVQTVEDVLTGDRKFNL